MVSLPRAASITIPALGDVRVKANLLPPFVSRTCIFAVAPVSDIGTPAGSLYSKINEKVVFWSTSQFFLSCHLQTLLIGKLLCPF